MASLFQITSKPPDSTNNFGAWSEIAFWTPDGGAGIFAWFFRLFPLRENPAQLKLGAWLSQGGRSR